MLKYGILLVIVSMFFCYTLGAKCNEGNKKPKGTVSFATVLLVNERSEVLLLRRKNTGFADGLYALPGGKIETGETALEAARREVKEEVRVSVEHLYLVHVVDRQGLETEFYIFVFKAEKWSDAVSNCEPHKSDDVRWFPLCALPENMLPAHRQAVELSQKGVLYSEHGWNS